MAMRLVLSLLLAALLVSCGASVKREESGAKLELPATAQGKVVLIVEPANPLVAKRPDWPALVDEFTAAMGKAAGNARLEFSAYKAGTRPAPEAGTLVTVTVSGFKLIGSDKLFALGAIAGSGALDTDVAFADLQTGKALGTRKYAASSGAFQGLTSAPSERQLDALAEQIFKDLARK
jgi:hypothetical protein